jgi:hypothetical protein
MRRLAALVLTVVLGTGLVACSDDGNSDDARTTDVPADATDAPDESTTSPGEGAATSTTAAATTDDYVSEIYADPGHWLCRPDMADDPCLSDLDVTVLNEDGTTEVQPFEPAADPPVDCFWVYPTINLGNEGNAPFDGEYGPELGVTHTMAARFSSLCRVYAPVYRQVTLGSFGEGGEEETQQRFDIAYGDVLDAFRHYLANDNDGRGFVLMGHSQGSGMISQLMGEVIDDDPALREQLISALVIGSTVAVPDGQDVGGDFDNIPACRAADQTGCVISYMSFRSTSPPPDNSFFGKPREGDGVALCTNPGALGGGSGELHAIYPEANEDWGAPIDTPFLALPGMLSAECVDRDGFRVLEVTVHGDPSGPRVDDITGDLTPEWGLHAVDYNIAMGDLLSVVDQEIAAYAADR